MVKRQPRIFYGWWIVTSFFITLFLAAGIGATHTVFFKPISGEFGWSRTTFSAVLSVNVVVGALIAPLWGRMVDRRGARYVVPVGVLIVGLSLVLLSTMRAMWQAYVLYIVLAIGAGGMSLVPISAAVSQWFVRRRGLAIGTTLVGVSLGGVVLAPAASFLATTVGWRSGYQFYGLAIWVILIPALLLIVRHRPQDVGLLPDGDYPRDQAAEAAAEGRQAASMQGGDLTLKAAVQTPTFWLIAVGFMLPMFAGRAILIHLVPIMTDLGVSPRLAATAYGLTVGLSLVGRLGFGHAADKFSKRHIYALCYAIQAIGIFCLIGLEYVGPVALVGFIVIFGCTYGGGFSLAPLLIGECFGTASLGEIFGVLGIAAMLGGAFGPIFAGRIYDNTGSYHAAFIVFLVIQIIAAAAILHSRPALKREANG
jgi:MFS family permease